MKKFPAIILLILGNLAAVYIVSVLITLLWWNTFSLDLEDVAFVVSAALIFVVSAAFGFASSLIYNKFKKKYGLKRSRFILAAYVPSAAVYIINFIIIYILNSLAYFGGVEGPVKCLSSLFFAAAAVLYLIFGSCFTLSATKKKADTKG